MIGLCCRFLTNSAPPFMLFRPAVATQEADYPTLLRFPAQSEIPPESAVLIISNCT